MLGVTAQMISILTEQNVRASLASLKPTDILIEPQLDHLLVDRLRRPGEDGPDRRGSGARRHRSPRGARRPARPSYAAFEQRRTRPLDPDIAPVDAIRFAETKRVNPEAPKNVIETGPACRCSRTCSTATCGACSARATSSTSTTGSSARATSAFSTIQAVEKSWGPGYRRFGLGLSYDFKGNALFDLAASFRRTWLDSLGAEWRTDLQSAATACREPPGTEPFAISRDLFVEPYAEARRTVLDLYRDDLRLASYNLGSRAPRRRSGH